MVNKKFLSGVLVIVLALGISGTAAFAQEHRHEPFDVLLGLNFGMGITPNIGNLFTISENTIPSGNYALFFDFGLTADFYLFSWLSFNSGMLLHPDIYVILGQELKNIENFTDVAASPLCLTIPLMAHINIPKVEWLYAGLGVNLNFPILGLLDAAAGAFADEKGGPTTFDTKGDFFVGLPIDVGFDFIKPGRGGMRFFFRVTPEFHTGGVAVPIGFMWQIFNWRIYSKK